MPRGAIVFATDYSEASAHALEYACQLAQCRDEQLLIVHVSEHELYPVGESFDEDPSPSPQDLQQLHEVVPEDKTVQYEHHLLYGESGSVETTKPAEVIAGFAKERDADMIVIGTHGRTGFSHLLMGSVAESLVRHAECPVVTIRQPKSASHESPAAT